VEEEVAAGQARERTCERGGESASRPKNPRAEAHLRQVHGTSRGGGGGEDAPRVAASMYWLGNRNRLTPMPLSTHSSAAMR